MECWAVFISERCCSWANKQRMSSTVALCDVQECFYGSDSFDFIILWAVFVSCCYFHFQMRTQSMNHSTYLNSFIDSGDCINSFLWMVLTSDHNSGKYYFYPGQDLYQCHLKLSWYVIYHNTLTCTDFTTNYDPSDLSWLLIKHNIPNCCSSYFKKQPPVKPTI